MIFNQLDKRDSNRAVYPKPEAVGRKAGDPEPLVVGVDLPVARE